MQTACRRSDGRAVSLLCCPIEESRRDAASPVLTAACAWRVTNPASLAARRCRHDGAEGPMMRFSNHVLRRSLVVLALTLVSVATLPRGSACAQDFPDRPITLIVPYPPGGGVDAMGRIVAQHLSAALGQQVIVENRGGAAGVIGMRVAARAAPDGYTLVMCTTGMTLPAKAGYDLARDFTPVALIASTPIVLMTHPSFPAATLADVVALAKRGPGKVNAGTPPPPTLNYFAAEMFKALTGAEITIVTYKGTGPLTNDLLGGHVAVAFNTIPPALGNIRAGNLRALAVAAPTRETVLPDVPTAAESGLPEFEAVLYYGIMAPAGTPPATISSLNRKLREIMTSNEVRDRVIGDGAAPLVGTPEDYAANFTREEAKWAALIGRLGLKVE
jgi:tripartite-type tricarboxylate transporter receptor subunit TctC